MQAMRPARVVLAPVRALCRGGTDAEPEPLPAQARDTAGCAGPKEGAVIISQAAKEAAERILKNANYPLACRHAAGRQAKTVWAAFFKPARTWKRLPKCLAC